MKYGVKRVIKYYNIMLINAYCYRLNYHTFKIVKINMRPCFNCDIYKNFHFNKIPCVQRYIFFFEFLDRAVKF